MSNYDPLMGDINTQMRKWERPSPFLRLPVELRDQIYGYLFPPRSLKLYESHICGYVITQEPSIAHAEVPALGSNDEPWTPVPRVPRFCRNESHVKFLGKGLAGEGCEDRYPGYDWEVYDQKKSLSRLDENREPRFCNMNIMRVCKVINVEAARAFWSAVTVEFLENCSTPCTFFRQTLQRKSLVTSIYLRLSLDAVSIMGGFGNINWHATLNYEQVKENVAWIISEWESIRVLVVELTLEQNEMAPTEAMEKLRSEMKDMGFAVKEGPEHEFAFCCYAHFEWRKRPE